MNPVEPWAPLGYAVSAYHRGHRDAEMIVESDVFETEIIPARHFYRPDDEALPELDRRALDRCRGTVLDAGAGAGRHALELQRRDLDVTALDIDPGNVTLMQDRGVLDARTGDVFTWSEGTFDTILLLMNGIGLAGSPERLPVLFQRFRTLLNPGGSVVFDASGLSASVGSAAIAGMHDDAVGRPDLGEVFFRLTFDDCRGAWYPWLFPSEDLLRSAAAAADFDLNIIARGARGSFLTEARPCSSPG